MQPGAVSRYGLPIVELNWYTLLSVPPCAIHGVNFRSHSLPSAAGIFLQFTVSFLHTNFLFFIYMGEKMRWTSFFLVGLLTFAQTSLQSASEHGARAFCACLENFAVKKSAASIENLFQYFLRFIKQENIM